MDETTLPFTGGPQCNAINVDQFVCRNDPVKYLCMLGLGGCFHVSPFL